MIHKIDVRNAIGVFVRGSVPPHGRDDRRNEDQILVSFLRGVIIGNVKRQDCTIAGHIEIDQVPHGVTRRAAFAEVAKRQGRQTVAVGLFGMVPVDRDNLPSRFHAVEFITPMMEPFARNRHFAIWRKVLADAEDGFFETGHTAIVMGMASRWNRD